MKNENKYTVQTCVSVALSSILAILLCTIPSIVNAAATPSNGAVPIKLAWDASPTVGVTNYVLYASTNTITTTNILSSAVRVSVGTNLTATISDLVPGNWYFAATAMKLGVESAPSNILQVQVPVAPTNMLTVFVQYSTSITNGFTDTGFFRLRIP